MTRTQTVDGVDITIDFRPATPANRNRLGHVFSALDRLASALNQLDPDWAVSIELSGIPITTITAEPTIEQDTAA